MNARTHLGRSLPQAFLRWWRPRRLHWRGLSTTTVVLFAGCLASAVLSAVVLVLESLGRLTITEPWSETLQQAMPAPVVCAVLAGFAAASAAVSTAALSFRRPARLLVLLGCLLPVGIIASWLLRGLVLTVYDSAPPLAGTLVTAGRVGIVMAAVVALCTVVVAVVRVPGPPLGAAVAAGQVVPYLVVAVVWAASRWSGVELSAAGDVRFPGRLPLSRVFESPIVMMGLTVAGVALILTVWLTYAGGRGTADVAEGGLALAARMARGLRRDAGGERSGPDGRWWFVAGLSGLKLLLYAASLSGLGLRIDGLDTLSADVRADGWLSWLMALAIAVVVLAWLRAGARGPRGEAAVLGAGVVIAALIALPELLFQALSGAYLFSNWDPLFTAALWVESRQEWGYVVAPAAAAAIALVLRVRGRHPAAVVLLALFAFWAGVRVPALLTELIRYPWFDWDLSMPAESVFGQRPGWVDPTTLDLALSAGLLAVAIAALRARAAVPLGPAALVALASTLLANSTLVLPDLLLIGFGVYLRFWLPLLYQLLFDAESLNADEVGRPRRLLLMGALNALALAVGALRGAHGAPGADADLQMASALLVVPVLATSVMMATERLARDHRSSSSIWSSVTGSTGSAKTSTSSEASTASTSGAVASPG